MSSAGSPNSPQPRKCSCTSRTAGTRRAQRRSAAGSPRVHCAASPRWVPRRTPETARRPPGADAGDRLTGAGSAVGRLSSEGHRTSQYLGPAPPAATFRHRWTGGRYRVVADSTRLPVLVTSTVKAGGDGQPLLIRTTVFDAPDRRAYEQELLPASQGAEQRPRAPSKIGR